MGDGSYNIQITENDRLNICKTQPATSNSRGNSVRNRITPRIKKSPSNKPEDGHCRRMCGNMSAVHYHIFWEGPYIFAYSTEVVTEIK